MAAGVADFSSNLKDGRVRSSNCRHSCMHVLAPMYYRYLDNLYTHSLATHDLHQVGVGCIGAE
jgi:hypothetical protein